MTPELEQKLYNKYPKLFSQKKASIMQSCMFWGIEADDGWFEIIDRMCSVIQGYVNQQRQMRSVALRSNRALKRALAGDTKYLKHFFSRIYNSEEEANRRIDEEIKSAKFREVPQKVEHVEFTQIKEKFGGLRVYTNYSNDYIDGAVSMAISMSYVTCEECGKQGKKRGHGWIYVSCGEHAKKGD